MKEWYYVEENEKKGPIKETELIHLIEQNKLKENDLVWSEGMEDWKPISSVSTLNPKEKINSSTDSTFQYASFLQRCGASLIDFFIVALCFSLCVKLIFPSLSIPAISGIFGEYSIWLGWLYFAIYESSNQQATWGKRILGLQVTDVDGNSIGFGKATGRYFGKLLSGLILCIGYIMVAFTQKKQGLHDIMAGTLILKK